MTFKNVSVAEIHKRYGMLVKLTDLMEYLGLTRSEMTNILDHPKIVTFCSERSIFIFSNSLKTAGFLD